MCSHPSPSQNKSGGGAERKRLPRPEKLTVVTKVTVSYAGPTLKPRKPDMEGMTFLPGLKVIGPLRGAPLAEVEAYRF